MDRILEQDGEALGVVKEVLEIMETLARGSEGGFSGDLGKVLDNYLRLSTDLEHLPDPDLLAGVRQVLEEAHEPDSPSPPHGDDAGVPDTFN